MKRRTLWTSAASLLLGLTLAAGCKDDKKPADDPAPADKAKAKQKSDKAWAKAKEKPAKPKAVAPKKPVDGWVAFDSKEGRFSARFPRSPRKQKVPVPTAAGTFTQTMFSTQEGGTHYGVGVVDYPLKLVKKRGPAKVLDGARDGATRNIGGKILSEKQITLAGWPARRLQVKGHRGRTFYVDSIIVLAGARLYQAMVVSPVANATADAKRFLDNFKPAAKAAQ